MVTAGERAASSEVVDQFEESTWSASTYRYGRFNMGMAADHVAKVYSIPRREQDEYALRSHQLAVKAIDGGLFRDDIRTADRQDPKGARSRSSRTSIRAATAAWTR